MSYQIYQFDGIVLSDLVQSGDPTDMGTGAALTSYVQLPGGGFYDNYGNKRSPQGIRPITKVCVLAEDTEALLKTALDNLRKKIGVTGKLTVRMGDGSFRWQWARLRNVQTQRTVSIPLLMQPVRLTWESAAQFWYGKIVTDTEWTWGDGSWVFGDGTAVFGENSETYTKGAANTTQAITHAGNIDAKNFRVIVDAMPSDTNTDFKIRNNETAQFIDWSGSLTSGQALVIDAGKRTIEHRRATTAISTIVADGTTVTVTTSSAHGLSTGQHVYIDGTTNFDGNHDNITVSSGTIFTYTIDAEATTANQETTGTIRRTTYEYANATISDKRNWLTLKPGSNTFQLTWDTYQNSYDIGFNWYDHYA